MALERRRIFRCDGFEATRRSARASIWITFLPNWIAENDVLISRIKCILPGGEAWNGDTADIRLQKALAQPFVRLKVVTAAIKFNVGQPRVWTGDPLLDGHLRWNFVKWMQDFFKIMGILL